VVAACGVAGVVDTQSPADLGVVVGAKADEVRERPTTTPKIAEADYSR
jgi:hypothetical protein